MLYLKITFMIYIAPSVNDSNEYPILAQKTLSVGFGHPLSYTRAAAAAAGQYFAIKYCNTG